MVNYIAKRFAALIFILFGLSLLTFSLMYILPSDPVQQLVESMGGGHDTATIENMQEKYGLNRPFLTQYKEWIKGVFRGDLGVSVKYSQPVSEVLARKLPNTILLACVSFLLMLLIALPLGILSAIYHNKFADYSIRMFSFIGISMPSFWLGLILIYLLSVKAHLLPVSGSESWQSLVMPTITLSIGMAATYIRRIRSAMLEQMNQLYIIGGQARGLSKRRIILRHILPNSLLSLVTMLGMSFGGLLGGTMIVETIFGWNGIGKTAVDAITNRDYQLIQGYVLWMGTIYVLVNLLVDISYHYLDPRIRLGKQS